MAGIGVPELLIVLVILLLVFGPKRLPGLGRQLGGGMREFKDSLTGDSKDDDDEGERPALTAAPSASVKADAAPTVAEPAERPTPASKTSA